MNFSIVVPVFNSSKTIVQLNTDLLEFFSEKKQTFEIIYVDDRSVDNSWHEIKRICETNSAIKAIRLAKNSGQHSATLCGIYKAQGDIIITIDDDLQYPVSEIATLIDYYKENDFALVFGISELRKRFNITNVFYKSVFFITNALFYPQYKGKKFSSFRVFSKTLIKEDSNNNLKRFDPYHLWELEPKAIGNIIVRHNIRPFGKSNYNLTKLFKHSLYALNHVLDKLLTLMIGLSLITSLCLFIYVALQIPHNVTDKPLLIFHHYFICLAYSVIITPILYITKYVNRNYLHVLKSNSFLISDEL